MKKALIICMATATLISMLSGCRSHTDTPEKVEPTPTPVSTVSPVPSLTPLISSEERKRMELYIVAMKGAYEAENGGDGFIAIKLDTLEGLSDQAKQGVIDAFLDITPEVYDFKDIETDETRFIWNEHRLDGTIDGTVLSVRVEEYASDHAVIEATSWFGSLGAVFPTYEAAYVNGTWRLECTGMSIS